MEKGEFHFHTPIYNFYELLDSSIQCERANSIFVIFKIWYILLVYSGPMSSTFFHIKLKNPFCLLYRMKVPNHNLEALQNRKMFNVCMNLSFLYFLDFDLIVWDETYRHRTTNPGKNPIQWDMASPVTCALENVYNVYKSDAKTKMKSNPNIFAPRFLNQQSFCNLISRAENFSFWLNLLIRFRDKSE